MKRMTGATAVLGVTAAVASVLLVAALAPV